MPLSAAAPLPWADIVTNAIIAVTRPSHSTRVVTAIAQNARPMHARSGFVTASKSCCRLFTTISSSAFLTHWCRSLAEQENRVCALVRSYGCHFIGSGSESEASGCRDGILRHLAHLGTDSPTAPSHSLCRAGWWPFSRARTLDLFTIQFLPAREGAQPCVSRQVLCWPSTRFPG